MAYPITGELGKVNSVTASTDLDQLLITATKHNEISYQMEGDQEDTTGDGETSSEFTSGLRAWSFDFRAMYPKTQPRFGNTGLLTYASGTATYVQSWMLDFDFGEEDITALAATGPTWKAFRPSGRPIITGSYVARQSNAAALAVPDAPNGGGNAATFRLTEDGTDPGFSGSIIVKSLGTTFGGRGLVLANYAFTVSGALTAIAGTTLPALLPAGTVDASDWGDGTDGPSTVSIVTQSAASRTYTGYGWLRRLQVSCNVSGLIAVTGTVRGMGALVPA